MSKNKLAIPRLTHFVAMLKENRYPNHPALVREMQKLDIAGAYSITPKTLQRDVAFLRGDYNAPIAYDYRRRGYYLMDQTWTWDIPQLNDSDLDNAIIAAHLAESIMPNPLGSEARKTVDALLSNSEYSAKQSADLLSLVACGASIQIKPEIFSEVFFCWRNQKVLHVHYSRAMDGESAELTLEPHILAFYEGCWYIKVKVLHSTNKLFNSKNALTLALHRISSAKASSVDFDISEEFIDAAKKNEIFDFPKLPFVKLCAKGKGLRFATELFNTEILTENDDRSKIIALRDVPEYKMTNFIFSWGEDFTVIEPESLRNRVIQIAETIIKTHKSANHSKKEAKYKLKR